MIHRKKEVGMMGTLYSEKQISEANHVNLVEYLRSEGESFEKSGREWRWMRHDSITIRGNQWYRHKEQKGGYPIEFLKYFYGLSFKEAMKRLLVFSGDNPNATVTGESTERKLFSEPGRAWENKNVFGYLIQQRFLDQRIVLDFIERGLIYEDVEYHNVVFAGYDDMKVMKHAHKRSTYSNFRMNVEGSSPECSFYFEGTSETIFVFEAPIDLLSYITLHQNDWKQHHYLALCGLSDKALIYRLSQNTELQKIMLCFDQDLAGQEAMSRMKEQLHDQDYAVQVLKSEYKDWNEDLKAQHGMDAQERVINERAARFKVHINNMEIPINYETGRTTSLRDVLSPFFHVLSYKKTSRQTVKNHLMEMIAACHNIIAKMNEQKQGFEYCPHKDKGSLDRRMSQLRTCIEELKTIHYQNDNQRNLLRAYQKTMSECLHLHFEIIQREEQIKMNQNKPKPKAPLIGADGNIFNLMGVASKVLKRNQMMKEANEMVNRITQGAQSYEEALMIIDEYVEIVSQEEMEEYSEMSWED